MELGDKIPKISLPDKNGNEIELSEISRSLVVYFYPKDFTPGCTKEACSFRDAYEDFKSLGAEVVGISTDSGESHERFSKKYQLPFILLSDKDKKAQNSFGVKPALFGLLPGRETFVFGKEGELIYRFNSMSGAKHTTKALNALKQYLAK